MVKTAVEIKVWGIVQGVGFRPFVARLAKAYNISGTVANVGGQVCIQAYGSETDIDAFFIGIKEKKPKQSEIVFIERKPIEYIDCGSFDIIHSRDGDNGIAMLPADLSICESCREELLNPSDSRYLHPFISCMACGPRYSIIDTIPYDRANTSMAEFPMCPTCKSQYGDGKNRRHHAQTIACHACGPQLFYRNREGREWSREQAFKKAVEELKKGEIIAIKVISGYHYACSPFINDTVEYLRLLKGREQKPFAVMFNSIEEVKRYCKVNEKEEEILKSKERPIVILKKVLSEMVESVCRDSRFRGAFLSYTPLQIMLINEVGPLVMTSANLSDRPVMKDDSEIFAVNDEFLHGILYNDRKIRTRMDDSVVKIVDNNIQMIRRARGYAPVPIHMETGQRISDLQILAVGGQLKNTFCLTKGNFAYLSQYNGDMEDVDILTVFKENLDNMQRLFRIKPQLVCCDLHPNYITTKFAEQLELPVVKIQHHYAHILSVMAEKGLLKQVIGVAFDGTGFGTDGKIWGGEFLVCSPSEFRRAAHLKYTTIIGGDSSIKETDKTAVAYQFAAGLEDQIVQKDRDIILAALKNNINTIETSSMGRLFDCVSSILEIKHKADYEAECAILLENKAAEYLDEDESFYSFVIGDSDIMEIDFYPMLNEILADKNNGVSKSHIAYKFHNTIAEITAETCVRIRATKNINVVALSGGVFQNRILMDLVLEKLRVLKFEVHYNTLVPPNDGGISLGQAYFGTFHAHY